MAADGSVIIDTRMDTSGVQNGVSAIRQSFNGLGSVVKKIGILIGGAFAIGKLAQFGKECVELGSNLAEVQNVVDVTFTTMSEKVNEFAKNAITSAGLSETMAKQLSHSFKFYRDKAGITSPIGLKHLRKSFLTKIEAQTGLVESLGYQKTKSVIQNNYLVKPEIARAVKMKGFRLFN